MIISQTKFLLHNKATENISITIFGFFRSSSASEKSKMLVESGVMQASGSKRLLSFDQKKTLKFTCPVCFDTVGSKSVAALSCQHLFCHSCWKTHLEYIICDGMNSGNTKKSK